MSCAANACDYNTSKEKINSFSLGMNAVVRVSQTARNSIKLSDQKDVSLFLVCVTGHCQCEGHSPRKVVLGS